MRSGCIFCFVHRLPNKHIFLENRFIYCCRIYLWLFVLYKHFTSTKGRRLAEIDVHTNVDVCAGCIDRPSVSLATSSTRHRVIKPLYPLERSAFQAPLIPESIRNQMDK